MKFVILMSGDDDAWNALSAAEQARVIEAHGECERELRASGRFVASWRLRPAAEARSAVRDAAGALRTEPGAYVAPQLGGAYVLEAPSRAEAEQWAARLRFMTGANEVREVWE